MKGEAIKSMDVGKGLIGPIPPELIRHHILQGLIKHRYARKERISEAQEALKSMETQQLEKTWFDIR